MTLHHLMLFVHLAGVIVWVGGMSFAHFCLRPASLTLPPPQRLALWHGVFSRFFPIVWLALAAIVGGRVVDLAYVEDALPGYDPDVPGALAAAINDQRLAPTVRGLQALGQVSVGMCSAWEFVEL